ncbi:MAG: deoxyribodipyrimidine photo-lyase [Cyclobacteriaceae bacterium]
MEEINIFWFRRDLRLFDNVGLYYALTSDRPVLPLFIFDKSILDDLEDKSDARVSFIHDRVSQLEEQVNQAGSAIKVMHTTPVEAFKDLLKNYIIKEVYTNRDYEPYATERDQKIDQLLKENGAKLLTFKDHVIFEQKEVLNGSGEVYKVFTPFKNKWLEKLNEQTLSHHPSEKQLHRLVKVKPFGIPSLEELRFKPSDIPIPSNEYPEGIIAKYDEQRNFPAIEGTSRLGIHFRFGTISIREAVNKAAQLNDTWLNELIWREFYQTILANFPHVVDKAFKPQYDNIPWLNNQKQFERWCNGTTGYPIVDAGMRELNATGYMHNRVRMITASFLTKHLLIDWRWGEAYFAKKLLDYELASNNGGWQWAAGTGTDAQPYFRVFNPSSQTDKFDKDKKYISRWVPEYGGSKYPEPIVDHKFARQRAIDTYKEALN